MRPRIALGCGLPSLHARRAAAEALDAAQSLARKCGQRQRQLEFHNEYALLPAFVCFHSDGAATPSASHRPTPRPRPQPLVARAVRAELRFCAFTGRSYPQPSAATPPSGSAPQPVPTPGTDTTLLEPLNARLAQLAAQSVRAAGAARVCAERLGRAAASPARWPALLARRGLEA